ncbi:phosphoribosylanthranilate isomerase [Flavobacterium granuli]|uniref:N-(5'-phosphoribosyl)anthranilate isomerase n=1 Tax=Flavobacterium granuli TaxID=280093 RepID=A0A1M5LS69_9FLAO|nr:phosphoribosylanthranilate isomerase [Flavobacterium granuli]PRZ24082.1 phosphoribosylanthranilate isomerase [Flavobacterium granuli]SHG67845.1 phosphoribosylanthranilate isomerase [Flavobacterium granuli]
MKLKICGMKYPDNILEVGALLPDYMGFIFWEKSARYFDGIIPELPKSIKKVGVFVNATQREILERIVQHDLQAVQLHGQESVTFCQDLKSTVNESIEIIKVFSVADDFNFRVLKPFEAVCDYFLFDTKGKLPGGNGTTFDWKVLENYPSSKPFFLSGGIGIDEMEVVNEISKTNLPVYCIDVNSKFEIEPGLKNIKLLYSFTSNLKL